MALALDVSFLYEIVLEGKKGTWGSLLLCHSLEGQTKVYKTVPFLCHTSEHEQILFSAQSLGLWPCLWASGYWPIMTLISTSLNAPLGRRLRGIEAVLSIRFGPLLILLCSLLDDTSSPFVYALQSCWTVDKATVSFSWFHPLLDTPRSHHSL